MLSVGGPSGLRQCAINNEDNQEGACCERTGPSPISTPAYDTGMHDAPSLCPGQNAVFKSVNVRGIKKFRNFFP